MKYTFNIHDNKVVCVSHYAGKPVRGIAKCNKEFDKFNSETGMELAKLRCDTKVASKRIKYTIKKLDKATENLVKAQKDVDTLKRLLDKSKNEYNDLKISLKDLEAKLDAIQS